LRRQRHTSSHGFADALAGALDKLAGTTPDAGNGVADAITHA
jgi:hypothetical protein